MKQVLIALIGLVVLGGFGFAAYTFLPQEDKYADAIYPRDITGAAVEPVAVSMRDQSFMVPTTSTSSETVVTLNLVQPSATRNYPMARFDTLEQSGILWAFDDHTTEVTSGLRAVPIAVATSSDIPMYYLAVLEDDGGAMRHVTSLPLDEGIRIRDLSLQGTLVTVAYQTHARGQDMAAVPTENTSAIIDIATARIVQAGRQPRFEIVETVRSFAGAYVWLDTVYADRTVEPVAPGAFTLTFDGRRLRLATDCNDGTTDFEPPVGSSTAMTVDVVTATDRFCTSEQEDDYFAMIEAITAVDALGDDGYAFRLADGEAVMNFAPQGRELEFAPTADEATTTSEAAAVE